MIGQRNIWTQLTTALKTYFLKTKKTQLFQHMKFQLIQIISQQLHGQRRNNPTAYSC